jgi:hypothetical protein
MPATINALGFSWITDSQPVPNPSNPVFTDPGPNLWLPANTASVNNTLQLTLAQNSGCFYYNSQGQQVEIWAAAQAVLNIASSGVSLTYGKIVATVVPIGGWDAFIGGCTAPGQNTSTTFGIFTYDPSAPAPSNEIDVVEIGYQNQNQATGWINQQPGGPTNSDAQFVVQPWDAANPGSPDWNNVHRIALNPALIPASNEVTFLTDWQAGALTYYAAYGSFTSETFPYTDANTIKWVLPAAASVPAPTPTMSLYINLWPYGGPTTGQTVQFQVTYMEIPVSG